MASIPAPSPFLDPLQLAMTVYDDYSSLPDGISFAIQKHPVAVNVTCDSGDAGDWIEADGAQNGDYIPLENYSYDSSNLQTNLVIENVVIENMNSTFNAVETEHFMSNYTNQNFSPSPPGSRQEEALAHEPQPFDRRCVRARPSHLAFYKEQKTADICEMPLVCDGYAETRFHETAAAGFCPRPLQKDVCERQKLDFDRQSVRAGMAQSEFYEERVTAEFCQIPLPCEWPTETHVIGTAPAGYCPRSGLEDACERQKPGSDMRASQIGFYGEQATVAALAGFCPRPVERQKLDFDGMIASTLAGSHCRPGCAMAGAGSNIAGSETENNDRATLVAAGDSSYPGTQPPADFGVIDLGALGPDSQVGFTSGPSAWSPVQTVSNFRSCTIKAVRKVYARFLDFEKNEASPVPEPASWALVLVGLIGLGCARRMTPRGASGVARMD